MSVVESLKNRSSDKCELCSSSENLSIYNLPPLSKETVDNSIYICATCLEQIEDPEKIDPNHWRCLTDSMWNEHQPVQIMAWRMLHKLKDEGWPKDLLDMLYLDDETLALARATGEDIEESELVIHKDSNGVVLNIGDSVVLIKDLPVKGSSMVAKRGTAVRRISLDMDNPEFIEGKVDGIQIVIITKYVKKL